MMFAQEYLPSEHTSCRLYALFFSVPNIVEYPTYKNKSLTDIITLFLR